MIFNVPTIPQLGPLDHRNQKRDKIDYPFFPITTQKARLELLCFESLCSMAKAVAILSWNITWKGGLGA
jgi:hypothetical protein